MITEKRKTGQLIAVADNNQKTSMFVGYGFFRGETNKHLVGLPWDKSAMKKLLIAWGNKKKLPRKKKKWFKKHTQSLRFILDETPRVPLEGLSDFYKKIQTPGGFVVLPKELKKEHNIRNLFVDKNKEI